MAKDATKENSREAKAPTDAELMGGKQARRLFRRRIIIDTDSLLNSFYTWVKNSDSVNSEASIPRILSDRTTLPL